MVHASTNGGGLGLSKKPLLTTIEQARTQIASIGHANAGCFFDFIVKKGLS